MTENSFEDLLAETEIDDQTLSQLVRLPMWTPRQAKQVLQAQARSGKSIVRFAARHRFSPSRLYTWRKRLEAPLPEAGVQAFTCPVRPSLYLGAPEHTGDRAAPPDRPLRLPLRLWVRMPSGATVRVYREAPEALVRCVLSALKEPAC